MPNHDIIFRNARLIDGTGEPSVVGDLAVSEGRIAKVGDAGSDTSDLDINADGLVLAPGFIDSHCHDDLAVIKMPMMDPKVSQGVTTVINGNCGVSIAPVLPNRLEGPWPLYSFTAEDKQNFPDFASYFSALDEAPSAVNVACLCGHSNLRHAVMDDLDKAATSAEIAEMCGLLDQAMQEGALGMSTGTYYPAASAAPTEEVTAIAETLAPSGGLYVTHMRCEANDVIPSVEETLRIGKDAGVPVVVSHHKCMGKRNHGKSSLTLAMIDSARERQSVALDAYPYTASSTFLQPERVNECSRVLITRSETMPAASGRDLADIAREMGCSPLEAAHKLVPAGAVYFMMDENDVQRILAYPATMIGSDGIAMDTHPHPRAWGTFPKVLGHYARDIGLFPLEIAVHKMTGLTAKTFGLKDRGELKVGNFADLVLFDPDRVIDTADFADPCCPAKGIEMVYANGVCTWADGKTTGNRPGQTLRRVI